MVGGPVSDEPVHAPDPAVGGMDLLAPPYADLARRERIGDDRRGDVAHVATREEVGLLGGLQVCELLERTVQRHIARLGAHVDQVERHQAAQALPMCRLDDEVGDDLGRRIHHHPDDLATMSIGAVDIRPDRELRLLSHAQPFVFSCVRPKCRGFNPPRAARAT